MLAHKKRFVKKITFKNGCHKCFLDEQKHENSKKKCSG